MTNQLHRREFVKIAGLTGVSFATGLGTWGCSIPDRKVLEAPGPDAAERQLALLALDEAKGAGADYVDVRISRHLFESVGTRERQITNVSKTESYGIGVRALVGGSWGFAATRDVRRDAVIRTAREAAAIAGTNDRVNPTKAVLAPVKAVPDGRWITPHEVDPFTIPIEEKANTLFRTNEAAMKVKGVRFVTSSVFSVKESRLIATSEGSVIQETFVRINPDVNITAIAEDGSDFQTSGAVVEPAGRGWEYVTDSNLPGNAPRWAEEAVMKLSAKPVEPGKWDVVLHPSNLWLTIHESIAHPTELDRALGYEANYAGTSFLAPPEKVLNNYKLGPEFMTFVGDRTQAGGCATVGWDDEGVPATLWPIIKNGIFVNYQTTREQADWIASQTGIRKSLGCAFGQDWSSIPFQRMPNVSLMPNPKDDLSEDAVLAATDRGLMFEGRASYSIDQQRYNFQFSGQAIWEIKNGKKAGMVRDVAYQARTMDFWHSMALLGGIRTYFLGASFGDAKGQPGQSNAVSHGCPTALFQNVNIVSAG